MSEFIGNAVIFLFKLAVFVGLPLFGIVKCTETEWWQESERKKQAQEKADATPHVIREADGCKVYAFKSGGSYHYFTRCGSTVTTERTYTENCGKNCTRQKSEVIVTENNK
jgi:hypothetical protein